MKVFRIYVTYHLETLRYFAISHAGEYPCQAADQDGNPGLYVETAAHSYWHTASQSGILYFQLSMRIS